jgi:hypothetical protein
MRARTALQNGPAASLGGLDRRAESLTSIGKAG